MDGTFNNSTNIDHDDTVRANISPIQNIESYLSIVCLNIEGLLSKLNDVDFLRFIHTLDFLTKLEALPKNVFSSFDMYFSPAIKLTEGGRPSGGTLVLIRSSLNIAFTHIKTMKDNTVVVKLKNAFKNRNKDLLIICTYIPPCNSPYYDHRSPFEKNGITLLETFLHNLFEEHANCKYIVCGDLNARCGSCQPLLDDNLDMYIYPDHNTVFQHNNYDDDTFSRVSKDTQTNAFGRSLMNICTIFDFMIVNGMKMCPQSGSFTNVSIHGNSVVDYFLLSHDLISPLVNMFILDRAETSHMAIKLDVPINVDIVNTHFVACNVNTSSITKYKWDVNKLPTFVEAMHTESTVLKLNNFKHMIENDVEHSLHGFNETVLNAASCMRKTNKHVFQSYQNKCNWFDNDCISKKKEVRILLNKYTKSNTDYSKQKFFSARREYKQLLKEKRKRFCKSKTNKLVHNCNTNSILFWTNIKEISNKQATKNNIDIDSWFRFFKNFFQSNNVIAPICLEHLPPLFDLNDNYNRMINNDDISLDEISHALRSIKLNKAVGYDLLSNEMLTCSSDVITQYLTVLLQYLFSNGIFPECWSISTIVPIYKKGETSLCCNYRPISLTSLVSKIYTGILNNRIKMHLDYNDVLCHEQGGYREGYSPIDHIFTLYSCVHKQFTKNRKLYAAFVDYKCCFDSVSREGLLKVLGKVGIEGKLFGAIKSIYKKVLARVKNNDQFSEQFACPMGLKQGCLCSPSLFLIFINELSIALNIHGKHGIQFLPGTEILFHLLFADDALLLSDTVTGLQNQLNVMYYQSKRLGLGVNLIKTKIIVFRKGDFLSKHEQWNYGGTPLDVVNMYKYLGVDFTTMMSFNNLTSAFVSKAKKACYEIMSSLKAIDCFDFDVFIKLFDSKVVPILLYASELWGCKPFDEIEKVHLFALKRFLNVSLHCSNSLVYAETGRYPLHICSQLRAVKFWFKLLKLPNDRIVNRAYHMLVNLDADSKTNWVSDIRTILISNGYGYVWLFKSVGCEKTFLFNLKQTLIDCFHQGWHAKVSDSEKYEFYYSFKSMILKEHFLSKVLMPKCFRDVLIKFRLGVSQINSHRYKFDRNKDKLYCPFCDRLNETETHVLFHCPAYAELRISYLPVNTLHQLFTKQELNFSLARFLFYVFKLRANLLTHMN